MNPNMEWSQLFVQALVEAGLTAVCISPGSRSTPLTLAFAAQKGMQIYRHLDERSAGFFALGLAVATDRPVALVCTSGTAVANYFPAIVEANMSQVPLLVLTGDRPHELRHSGTNQTMCFGRWICPSRKPTRRMWLCAMCKQRPCALMPWPTAVAKVPSM